jgi:hypothetical protein
MTNWGAAKSLQQRVGFELCSGLLINLRCFEGLIIYNIYEASECNE